jgi:hypothetical protein
VNIFYFNVAIELEDPPAQTNIAMNAKEERV